MMAKKNVIESRAKKTKKNERNTQSTTLSKCYREKVPIYRKYHKNRDIYRHLSFFSIIF
jgi:hypothetical protein